MKRLPVVAALVATAAGATVAEAAIRKGSFSGSTAAADPVTLKVDGKGRVHAFTYDGVHMTCSDGDEFDTGPGLGSPAAKRYRVTKGKFKIKVRETEHGRGWDINGRFRSRGKAARGTLTIFAKFDASNNADPNGSVECSSGTLKWSAKRK